MPNLDQPAGRWRVFCAINLPLALRERVQVHIARLRESVPEARASWNRDDKLHLTIKFLGDIDVDRVAALSLAAERAVAGMKPISLTAKGCGAFPDRGRPRVLWIGTVDEDEGLARLNQRLETECAAQGFAREQRDFRPHLTIARVRQPAAAVELADAHQQMGFPPLKFEANELVVIRSELSGAGSRYTNISRHPLL
jgi:RNA 2',3'-cyclic 3'-phosphodiesterase